MLLVGTACGCQGSDGSTESGSGESNDAGQVTSATAGAGNDAGGATSSSTTGANTSGTGDCPEGAVRCPDRCANLSFDVYNCGSCGNVCPAGQACRDGACDCQGGLVDCGGGCISTDESAEHCGACDNPCATNLVCSEGVCSSGCASHLTRCGQSCTDTNGSSQHCGACDNACPEGQTCSNSECTCGSGQMVCDGVCTDVLSNDQHCGSCDTSCQGAETCVNGFCVDPSSLDCGGNASGNTCTNFDQNVHGKYYLFNNLWGADENDVSGEQCLWHNCLVGDLIGWGTNWSWPNTSGVKSYTSVVLGWHWGWIVPQAETGLPVRLDSATGLTCGWSFDVVNADGAAFTAAYDLWTHTTPDPGNVSPSDEIMIWVYHQGAVGPIGSRQATVTLAGTQWDLYRGAGGATWEVFSYVRSSNTTTSVMDLTDFTDDLVGRGWIESSKYLVSVEAGPEVSGGSGELTTRGFYCRNQ